MASKVVASKVEVDPEMTAAQRLVPRIARRHVFVTLIAAGALLGGGLRFIPTSDAATPGTSTAGQAAGSTACAAS